MLAQIIILFFTRFFELQIEFEKEMNERESMLKDNPVEYHKWFQIHYPAMQADLEDAYTEWSIYGEKDTVEYHKGRLDIRSHFVDLQKAKISLRSSKKMSLDRATSYYPVNFEPSNWYQYIHPRLDIACTFVRLI